MVLGLSNVSRCPERRFFTQAYTVYARCHVYVRLTAQPLGNYFYVRNRKSKSKTLLSFCRDCYGNDMVHAKSILIRGNVAG